MFPQIIIVGSTVPYVYVFIENYFLSHYTSEVAYTIRQNCLVHKNGQLKRLIRLNHSLTRPRHSAGLGEGLDSEPENKRFTRLPNSYNLRRFYSSKKFKLWKYLSL